MKTDDGGGSVSSERALNSALHVSEQLGRAVAGQASIDQAVGILISQTGCSGTEGYETLRWLSGAEHKKLTEVARSLIREAVDDGNRYRNRVHRPGANE
ncbi:ANTAR domain-containing protein [Rhodococcoides navarretei]|uniref:ANTAR domain-containing protein n=1 Tax=Rhodococcus navarretei TaxID=3128981 RepID=UPI003BFA0A68